ncbi:MAG: DUF3630 family protein [Thermoanaerobaculales bacterium]|nr:DUF3630 family protein [Thermoanaerobaculales bacterium]
MDLEWTMFTRPEGESYRQIEVSRESSWNLFDQVAKQLENALNGVWTEKLDGLDQRYWDLSAQGGRITLHLEHYLGISVYPSEGNAVDVPSLDLLENTFAVLADYVPTQLKV